MFATRSRCLAISLVGLLLTSSKAVRSDEPGSRTPVQTFVYKTVGPLEIKADVFRPENDGPRPVLVWIHGGALIRGDRTEIPDQVREWARSAGDVLVSLEYRLAPETKLPEIIADVEDAFRWVREQGPELFHADVRRIAVAGASAGGYLTLTAGYRVQPPPTVIVAIYGHGDPIGDWMIHPSQQPRYQQKLMNETQAWQQVTSSPLTDSRDVRGDRFAFYYFCRREGIWPKAVSGWDPEVEADRFTPYRPVRNVTAKYPPCVLIHGTNDTDVPFAQSELMAEQLRLHHVPYILIPVPNADHSFQGGDPKTVNDAYRSAFDFVQTYMK